MDFAHQGHFHRDHRAKGAECFNACVRVFGVDVVGKIEQFGHGVERPWVPLQMAGG